MPETPSPAIQANERDSNLLRTAFQGRNADNQARIALKHISKLRQGESLEGAVVTTVFGENNPQLQSGGKERLTQEFVDNLQRIGLNPHDVNLDLEKIAALYFADRTQSNDAQSVQTTIVEQESLGQHLGKIAKAKLNPDNQSRQALKHLHKLKEGLTLPEAILQDILGQENPAFQQSAELAQEFVAALQETVNINDPALDLKSSAEKFCKIKGILPTEQDQEPQVAGYTRGPGSGTAVTEKMKCLEKKLRLADQYAEQGVTVTDEKSKQRLNEIRQIAQELNLEEDHVKKTRIVINSFRNYGFYYLPRIDQIGNFTQTEPDANSIAIFDSLVNSATAHLEATGWDEEKHEENHKLVEKALLAEIITRTNGSIQPHQQA